ncbi:TPA: tape measure protein [Serratia marcescens]
MAEQDGGSLVYQVDIETAKMVTGSRQAAVVLGEMEKQANRSSKAVDGLTSSADSAGRSMSGFKSVLSGVASAISVALIIDYGKAFLTVADNITQLQSRILRLSTDASTAMSTFETLTAIASTTGASLRDTAKLWEAMTSALKGTGATNTQILALTDTLQKIGRVGGSSTEEMANALRQFGQSISSGTVRAEEFNSILEQMPELARQIGAGMGLSMGQLRQAMLEGKLSAQDALNAIMKQSSAVNDEFSKLPRTMDQASNSLTISLQNLIGKMNEAMGASATMVKIIDSISAAIDRLSGKTETASQKIADLTSTGEMYARRARTWSWLGLDGWSEQNQALAALSNKAATLIGDMNSVAKASENAANGTINFNNSGTANPKQDALVKRSQRRIELSKLEGEAKARLQALYDAEDAGIPKNDPRVKKLQDQYAEIERNTKAQKESNAEGKKSASQAESVAQKLANLKQQSELAADSTSELSREQAILTAQQSLGKGATQAQIAEAGAYAAKKWDMANAIKAQAAAEKLLPEAKENASYAQDVKDLNTALAAKKISQEQYNTTAEQLEQQHQINLAKIRAEAVVSPQQQAAGMVDPVQQLANENAQKLALIQQFETAGILQHGQAIALKNAQDTTYEQARFDAIWNLWKSQDQVNGLMGTAIDSLSSGTASALSGIISGTQSAGDAMRNLAAGALNAVLQQLIQMAVQALLVRTILGSFMGGLGAIPSFGSISSSVGSVGAGAGTGAMGMGTNWQSYVSGARKSGGPVASNGLYRFGEGGKPELYQSSTGKNYLLPGEGGKVISNKDMQGGGGINVNVSINNTNGSYVDHQVSSDGNGGVSMEIFIADMDNGGPMSQAISRNHQAPRRATQ